MGHVRCAPGTLDIVLVLLELECVAVMVQVALGEEYLPAFRIDREQTVNDVRVRRGKLIEEAEGHLELVGHGVCQIDDVWLSIVLVHNTDNVSFSSLQRR